MERIKGLVILNNLVVIIVRVIVWYSYGFIVFIKVFIVFILFIWLIFSMFFFEYSYLFSDSVFLNISRRCFYKF